MTQSPITPLEGRFFVEPNSGCWLWTRSVSMGYGKLWWDKKHQRAHRVSWELHNGAIPDGMLVLHKCDTPPCINPAHLFLGTHADNAADKIAKGRWVASGVRLSRIEKSRAENQRKPAMTTGHRPFSRRSPVIAFTPNLRALEAAVLAFEKEVVHPLILSDLTPEQRSIVSELAAGLNHTVMALRKEPA